MERSQGRRGPLSRLTDRFSLDSLRARKQRESQAAEELKRLQQIVMGQRQQRPKKSIRVEHPNARAIAKRRAKKKGIVRKNKTKRIRYLRAQKKRISR